MPTKDRFYVVRPEGVRWAGLYRGESAAWSHLLGVKRLTNTPVNRAKMKRAGWRVIQAEGKRDGSG